MISCCFMLLQGLLDPGMCFVESPQQASWRSWCSGLSCSSMVILALCSWSSRAAKWSKRRPQSQVKDHVLHCVLLKVIASELHSVQEKMNCSKGNSTWVMVALGCSTQGLYNSMAAKWSNRRLRSQVKTMLFVVFHSWVLLKAVFTKQQHLGDGGFGVERAGLVEQQGSKVVEQAAPVPGEGDGLLLVPPLQDNVPEGLRLMGLDLPAIAGCNEDFLQPRSQTIF